MDFFDAIFEKKLVILIISLILNGLLLSISGYLLYNKFTFVCPKAECSNNLVYNDTEIKDDFYIEIKGEVKNPGVYEVNSNNIINDVVTIAGGFTKKAYTKNINLSKRVSSELVIYVYSKEEYESLNEKEVEKEIIIEECICPTYDISDCTNNGNSEIITNDSIIDNNSNKDNSDISNNNDLNDKESNNVEEDNKLININNATKEELMSLNGIGESKANAIIEYRNKNKFNTIDDIKNVSGIGDSAFEKIKDSITV